MSEFAERIKEVVNNSVLTQRKVAALVGVTETALSNWLNGSRGMSVEKINKILTAIEPFTGDHRFYVFTGETPEQHFKAFQLNDRNIAKDDVNKKVQNFLLNMNARKKIVLIGKLDEIMEDFVIGMKE